MPNYTAPLADMQFILREVFNIEAFWNGFDAQQDLDWDTAWAVLQEASKICHSSIAPLNRHADETGCRWQEGQVITPAGFKEAYRLWCEGGWCGLGGNPAYGGSGMPKSLVAAVEEMLQGSCMALGLAPMLTAGACVALDAHANETLKTTYLPKLYAGTWAGVMDLTEPHAGTDLGLLRTKAEPQADGSFSLTGTKIFITWGEQDFSENIIHLVLARMPDAPAGVKGLSLFLVPKFLPDADQSWQLPNALSCGALEKKMGIKASATCVMNFDGAQGWLVGQANEGLACMFTMMNYERLVVGIQGLGVAQASYGSALDYAKTRLQSRSPLGVKNPQGPADPILEHPDVRRMLLSMRAFTEAGRAFYIYVAMQLDTVKFACDPEQIAQAQARVALLTPLAKAFITDMAFESAVLGQQVLGGHGYVREWGQEQHVRDARITQIYEGTNGIQAMDLLGRKLVASGGRLLDGLREEVEDFVASQGAVTGMAEFIEPLHSAWRDLHSCSTALVDAAQKNPAEVGANAVDYLHLLGYCCYAYLWARMVAAAQVQPHSAFYAEKIQVGRFYFQRLLPQRFALQAKIQAGASSLINAQFDAAP
jgi:alkylation response protein AidB-like acyl-CoA dehydrogenase